MNYFDPEDLDYIVSSDLGILRRLTPNDCMLQNQDLGNNRSNRLSNLCFYVSNRISQIMGMSPAQTSSNNLRPSDDCVTDTPARQSHRLFFYGRGKLPDLGVDDVRLSTMIP